MYARTLAQFRLLPLLVLCLASSGASLPKGSPTRALLPVRLVTPTVLPSGVMMSLRKELQSIMGRAGYELELSPRATSGDVTVELRGACVVRTHASTIAYAKSAIASTAIVNGAILPSAWVNCDRVEALLAPRIADQPNSQRDYLTGRAVARLIAHELYHVLARERSHTQAGLAQESLGAQELLDERGYFDATAIREMQPLQLTNR